MSEYAHGTSEEKVVIRLRAAKRDLTSCTLFYGDTACRKTPIDFYPVNMEVVASDKYFDYYEAEFTSRFNRLYYYFELKSGDEKTYYFSDFFRNELPDDRSEYYKIPIVHRSDIADVPDWLKNAVIYNIFPDSFADGKESISGKGRKFMYKSPQMEESVPVVSRLGGTINGITENVHYLKELGINCIYINPVFAAGEYHKYDLLDYFRVCPSFGTNEDFGKMVDTFHENGIKVIIDGVFNHCGWKFFAFDDVVRNGEKSKYKDWFYGLEFPVVRPDNPEDYPSYACFAYERLMPKLDTANPEVRDYLCSVGAYWIREFHIDGWRLDVASELNDDFWRCFRKAVKSENPEAVLIGEVWEKAGHWMGGDMFDSTMNYDLRKFASYFFARKEWDAEMFNAGVTDMLLRYRKNLEYGQLNLLDSHDVPRFLSVCEEDINRYKLAVVFQMMFVGAPSVFYGDEQLFTGKDELDYRRAMSFDKTCSGYSFFRDLIAVRHKYAALRTGKFRALLYDAASYLYAFERSCDGERITVILNNGDKPEKLEEIYKRLEISSSYEKVMEEGCEDGFILPGGYLIRGEI